MSSNMRKGRPSVAGEGNGPAAKMSAPKADDPGTSYSTGPTTRTSRNTAYDPDYAAAVMRAAGFEPLTRYPGARDAWPCRCRTCGQVSPKRFGMYTRTTVAPPGCVYCSRRAVTPDDAAAVMRAAGLEPLEPYPGKNSRPWPCRCTACGRTVDPAYASVQGGGGCRYCAGKGVVTPEIALEALTAHGWEPLEPYPGTTNARWRLGCAACGKPSVKTLAGVRSGKGCRYCAGNVRLSHDDAAARMRAAGFEPLDPYPGAANRPWRVRHLDCGLESSPRLANITIGQGCARCAVRGYWGGTGDGHVYLVQHLDLRAVKVGISRDSGRAERMRQHREHGWTRWGMWSHRDPRAAHAAERAVIESWRGNGLPEGVAPEHMPQGGYTETAPADLVDLARTRDLITATLDGWHAEAVGPEQLELWGWTA